LGRTGPSQLRTEREQRREAGLTSIRSPYGARTKRDELSDRISSLAAPVDLESAPKLVMAVTVSRLQIGKLVGVEARSTKNLYIFFPKILAAPAFETTWLLPVGFLAIPFSNALRFCSRLCCIMSLIDILFV
jgi:hypothetical protein